MQRSSFILQSELVDAKVEVSVSRAVAAVVEQIVSLRQEMHQEMGSLRSQMHEFSTRLVAVETTLVLLKERHNQIRERFLDYSFKAGWLIIISLLSGLFSWLAIYLHSVHP